jgi:small GTP-binding protein
VYKVEYSFFIMRYNVCFVGNISAGKSSIIQRKINGHFKETPHTTIACDFYDLQIGDSNVAIWDTAGEERFLALSKSYFARGHIFVLVNDLLNSKLNDLTKWYNIIHDECVTRHNPVVIVASNKCDADIPFCSSEIESWIRNNDLEHVYTSAKSGEGIDKLFSKMGDAIEVHQSNWLSPSLPSLVVNPPMKEMEGCNC